MCHQGSPGSIHQPPGGGTISNGGFTLLHVTTTVVGMLCDIWLKNSDLYVQLQMTSVTKLHGTIVRNAMQCVIDSMR